MMCASASFSVHPTCVLFSYVPAHPHLLIIISCAALSGAKRQQNTRGLGGLFFSDGIRCTGGGGADTVARGWHLGQPEWYHYRGDNYPKQDSDRQEHLLAMKQCVEAWRSCRSTLMTLLYSYLTTMVGSVLLTYQTAVNHQPGMEGLWLQPDVPYQQMQSSLNAHVGVHKDCNDLFGTVIIWLAMNRAAHVVSADAPTPGGAFVLYDLGCMFEVGHLSHLWVRSDRHWHGTIKDYSDGDEQQGDQAAAQAAAARAGAEGDGGNHDAGTDAASASASASSSSAGPKELLFGTAFANTTSVTTAVVKVLNQGGLVTWTRKYDADPPANVTIVARSR